MGQLTSLLSKPLTLLGVLLLVVLTVFALMDATMSGFGRLEGVSAGIILIVMFALTWFLVPPLRTTTQTQATDKAQNALGLMLLEVSAFYAGANVTELLYSGLLPAALIITVLTVILVLRHRRGATPTEYSSSESSSASDSTPETPAEQLL